MEKYLDRGDELTFTFLNNVEKYKANEQTSYLKSMFRVNLHFKNFKRVAYLLDKLDIPTDLSLEERVSYFQLFG